MVTPRGLGQLIELTNLELLNVDLLNVSLTDEAAVSLTALTKLKSLVVSSSDLTDAGLASLKVLTDWNRWMSAAPKLQTTASPTFKKRCQR